MANFTTTIYIANTGYSNCFIVEEYCKTSSSQPFKKTNAVVMKQGYNSYTSKLVPDTLWDRSDYARVYFKLSSVGCSTLTSSEYDYRPSQVNFTPSRQGGYASNKAITTKDYLNWLRNLPESPGWSSNSSNKILVSGETPSSAMAYAYYEGVSSRVKGLIIGEAKANCSVNTYDCSSFCKTDYPCDCYGEEYCDCNDEEENCDVCDCHEEENCDEENCDVCDCHEEENCDEENCYVCDCHEEENCDEENCECAEEEYEEPCPCNEDEDCEGCENAVDCECDGDDCEDDGCGGDDCPRDA